MIYHFVEPGFPASLRPPKTPSWRNCKPPTKRSSPPPTGCGTTSRHRSISSCRSGGSATSWRRREKPPSAKSRRLMAVGIASLLGIVLIAALMFVLMHGQKAVALKVDRMTSRLDESAALIKHFLAERPLDSKGRPIIPQLSGELRQRRGVDRQGRQEAAQACRAGDERLYDVRSAGRGDRTEEAAERNRDDFEMYLERGDRWYRAQDFDKAVGPYEQALALRPDVRARTYVALAQTLAAPGEHRRSSAAGNRHRRRHIQARYARFQRLGGDAASLGHRVVVHADR